MSPTEPLTNDYRLKMIDYRLMTNNFVNSLMPYCYSRLHLTLMLEWGLDCKKPQHALPLCFTE